MNTKKILQNDLLLHFLCWLGSLYIRLCAFTGRWQTVNGEIPARFWDAGQPFILSFWHGRLLMMPYCWRRGISINVLISQHPDGRILSRTVGHFGIRTITGSSSKGGSAALRAMVRTLKSGECIGLTPDGPRGPRMRAAGAIVSLARLSQTPILPVAFGITRGKVLGSWDRFLIALPFSKGVFVWGEPIIVPANADAATLNVALGQVEEALNAVTRQADELSGRTPVEPAPIDGGTV
ncbi:MAG: lysophospholipid acyltransferase family protein [Rhodospirillaceae bacterium]|jgi:lysophospholipid acyltransferase (LPLAT)-like uncharacterized protein|nr:lysophospholipid acyltransferase family protein [Rhodospirillaceae bacterium]MBT5373806.1 lysophospholipid acyltransferase family protein [Rhodospirillaceae bacterium]MBT5751203.1 lysophospholipid acyltransferase family protein [Rhodospirillaceae bacterium]